MPVENKFDVDFSKLDRDQIVGLIRKLTAMLVPPLITLTAEDRQNMPKTGEKNYSLVTKAYDYATRNTELVPSFLKMANFEHDVESMEFLKELHHELGPLATAVEDSLTLAGSEALQEALVFYKNVRQAAETGDTKAKPIYDDLAVRFPGYSHKEKKVS